ncbi:MAG: beta-phosphoglucomutase [Oscillospiraceae bacterium]|jgi:beta-phosphoglucomutase|nr:beta-phosphoglucomutase [Oscillospiraceae bacterium]
MSAINGLIFDLDGVLVDTARFHYLAWRRLAQEWFQMAFTEADNERFKGVNRVACMKILCEMAGVTLDAARFEEGMALKNGWYVQMVEAMTPADVLPGARDYVARQRARGLRCAIGSASKNCALVLERTELGSLFDAVCDGTVVQKAKPDPEVFLRAAEMLSLSPTDCVVFEDAQAGLDAARAGGMRAYAIGRADDLTGYDWIAAGLATAKDL